MKEEKKSEFSSKMEEIAKQATALVEKDSKKSVIIIATESDDDDGMAATIAIAGHGKELAKAISEFATNDGSKELFVAGIKMAQTKMMFQSLEKVMGGGVFPKCQKIDCQTI